MIKEAKNVDFYTTGRQPSQEDFARVSEWIKKNKQKQSSNKSLKKSGIKKPLHSNKNVQG